jgi:Smg protein
VNESVIDVLIYLYEHYMDGESAVPSDQIILEEELVQAGFPKGEIKKAFDWLDELAWRQGSLEYRKAPNQSIRVYNEDEQRRLDVEIQGLLLYLEQNGILDPFSRELVIERAMALDTRELSVDDVKWIVLLVLMNQPDQEDALELMEEFVYHGDSGTLH